MAASTPERVALLSIRPPYAEAIFDGRKEIEFRRWLLAEDISVILVYATRPLGSLIGWFEVAEVVAGTPSGLWKAFAQSGAIDRQSYREYFRDADRAYGIRVRRAFRLAMPTPLSELRRGLRPPQSVHYLPAEVAGKVIPSLV